MLIFNHMNKIDAEEIKHIAKLSKLELSKEEIELYQRQLSSVLNYFEQLKKVDTEGIEPLANITGQKNVFREDEVKESGITHEDIKKNAPKFSNDSFIVPGVFK